MILAPVPSTVAHRIHGPVVTLLLVNRPPTPSVPVATAGSPTPGPLQGGEGSVQVTVRSVFVTGDPGPLRLTRLTDVAAVVAANHDFWIGDTTEADPEAASAPLPEPAAEATSLVGVQERVDIPLEPSQVGGEPDPLDAAMAELERRQLPYQVVAVQGAPFPNSAGRNGSGGAADLAFLDRIGLLVRVHLACAMPQVRSGLPRGPVDLESWGPWVRARIVRGGEVVELITTRGAPRTLQPVDADGLPRAVEHALGSLAVGEVGIRAP